MATLKIICRESKPLKDGSLPIVIRLSHLKNPVCYLRVKGLFVVKVDEWDKELQRFKRKRKDYKALNAILTDVESKADTILVRLLSTDTFSYQKFKDCYYGSNISDLVLNSFEHKIDELTKLNRHGTAEAYKASMNAVKGFVKNNTLVFSDIDYRWLKKFENHLRSKGNAGNTISYKIRSLRALHYSYCHITNEFLPTSYSRFKVGRLTTATIKRTLDEEELKRFINYTPVTKGEKQAKDIFMFSLLTRGMNIADISLLKMSNIVGSNIIYERSKTGKVFVIAITKEIQSILDSCDSGKYLFPIINDKHKDVKYSTRLFTKNVNNNLQRIASKIEIYNTPHFLYQRGSFLS